MFGEANSSLLTTRQCHCELVSHAERHVTLAWDAVLLPSLDDGALPVPAGSAAPVVKPVIKLWVSLSGSRNGGFSPPLLPFLSIMFPWKKAALNFFPGLSCQGRAQRVASACHVTLVFAVSHAMTSQPDWRTTERKLLYVKMGKLSLSRKQAGEHQLQMGREKKPRLF